MITGTYKVSRTINDPNTGATSIALAQNFTSVLNQPEGGLPNTATSKVTESFFPVPDKFIGDPEWYKNKWLFWEDPTRNTGARPKYDPNNPRATTNLLDFPWAVGTWGTPAGPNNFGTVFSRTFVDMRRIHCIYLHSLDIGNMATIAPRGIRTCLAVIAVTAGYGALNAWTDTGNTNNCIKPATRSLKRFNFEIRTSRGDKINLQGGHWTAVFAIGPRPL